jgi:integrase
VKGHLYKPSGRKVLMMAYRAPRPDGSWGLIRESAKTDDWTKARKLLDARVRAAENHRDGVAEFEGPAARRVTVGELLDELLADYRTRQIKGLYDAEFKLRKGSPLRDAFGDLRAEQVTAARLDGYIAARRAGGRRNATINRDFEMLRRAFRLAIARRRLVKMPAFPSKLSEKDGVRQGFFERAELEAVLPHLPAELADMARFAFLTGWRRGELLGLRWEWVDLKAGEIRLPDTKSGRPRSLPLSGELREIMARRWEARRFQTAAGVGLADYVFHVRGRRIHPNTFGNQWRAAAKAAKVPGRLFHDLRRTAVRNMVRAGVPQAVAMSISGHETTSMFTRYNVSDDRDKLAALEAARRFTEAQPAAANVVALGRVNAE